MKRTDSNEICPFLSVGYEKDVFPFLQERVELSSDLHFTNDIFSYDLKHILYKIHYRHHFQYQVEFHTLGSNLAPQAVLVYH